MMDLRSKRHHFSWMESFFHTRRRALTYVRSTGEQWRCSNACTLIFVRLVSTKGYLCCQSRSNGSVYLVVSQDTRRDLDREMYTYPSRDPGNEASIRGGRTGTPYVRTPPPHPYLHICTQSTRNPETLPLLLNSRIPRTD